jgi:hypothetical protein
MQDAPQILSSAGSGATGRTAAVVLVFSPGDCAGTIEALRLWNSPHETRRIAVRGLLYGLPSGSDVQQKIVRGAGLRFPVEELDDAALAKVRRALGYGSGSFVVMLDRQGRVRLSEPLAELSTSGRRADALSFAEALAGS